MKMKLLTREARARMLKRMDGYPDDAEATMRGLSVGHMRQLLVASDELEDLKSRLAKEAADGLG